MKFSRIWNLLDSLDSGGISKGFFWEEEERKKSPSSTLPIRNLLFRTDRQDNFPLFQTAQGVIVEVQGQMWQLILHTGPHPDISKPPGEVCASAASRAMTPRSSWRQEDVFLP